MIRFRCPTCSRAVKVSDRFAGKTGACPRCHQTCTIPAAPKPNLARRVASKLPVVRLRRQPAVNPTATATLQAASSVWASPVTRILVWLILLAVLVLLALAIGAVLTTPGCQPVRAPYRSYQAPPPPSGGSGYAPPPSERSPSSDDGKVHVRGHYRKDGTYVRPYTRRRPRRK